MYKLKRLKKKTIKPAKEKELTDFSSISIKVAENLATIKTIFGNTNDLVTREFKRPPAKAGGF